MVVNSKILTVAYGTFSCTLEGFDDPFSTMKDIAEYFRDLAAEDRFFGAEPPTPDAEMLTRIASRSSQSTVQAELGENTVTLRPTAQLEKAAAAQDVAEHDEAGLEGQDTLLPSTHDSVEPIETDAQEPAEAPSEIPQVILEEPVQAPIQDALEERAEQNSQLQDETAEHEPTVDVEPQQEINSAQDDDAQDGAQDRVLESTLAALLSNPNVQFDAPVEVAPSNAETIEEAPVASDLALQPEAEITIESEAVDLGAIAEALAQCNVETDENPEQIEATEDDGADIAGEALTLDEVVDTPKDDLSDRLARIQAAARGELDEMVDLTEADPAADFSQASDEDSQQTQDVAAEPQSEAASDDSLDLSAVAAAVGTATALATAATAKGSAPEQEPEEELASPKLAEEIDAARERIAEQVRETTSVMDRDLGRLVLDTPAENPVEDADLLASLEDTVSDVRPGSVAAASADAVPSLDDEEASAHLLEAELEAAREAAADAAEAQAEIDTTEQEPTPRPRRRRAVRSRDEAAGEEGEPRMTRSQLRAQRRAEKAAQAAAELDAEAEADLQAELSSIQAELPKPAAVETPEVDDRDLDRLFKDTDERLNDEDAARRHAHINHLKAAVAARQADAQAGDGPPEEDEMDAYRADLASAVRPRRAAKATVAKTPRPLASDERPAPLVLVTEQRIDEDETPHEAKAASPVRPRRVRRIAEAVEAPEPATTADNFADYAEGIGAHDVVSVLEAAGTYAMEVEGAETFSRPHVMRLAATASGAFSREDCLRGFGELLRDGRIEKIGRGAFRVSSDAQIADQAAG